MKLTSPFSDQLVRGECQGQEEQDHDHHGRQHGPVPYSQGFSICFKGSRKTKIKINSRATIRP